MMSSSRPLRSLFRYVVPTPAASSATLLSERHGVRRGGLTGDIAQYLEYVPRESRGKKHLGVGEVPFGAQKSKSKFRPVRGVQNSGLDQTPNRNASKTPVNVSQNQQPCSLVFEEPRTTKDHASQLVQSDLATGRLDLGETCASSELSSS